MKISEFLDVLEHRKLVSRTVVARLREKAAEDPERLTPKAVLKYLVKKELIERSAAEDLLRSTLTVSRAAESSILGNMPLPEVTAAESDLALVTEEEIPTLTPIDSRQNLRIEEIDEQGSESSSIFDDSQNAPALSSGKLSSLSTFSSKAREESAVEQLLKEGQSKAPPRPKKAKAKGKAKRERGKSEWDSSLILYGGGGLLVLILAGGIIYYLLNRENADFVLEQATDYFEGGSYTQAIAQYEKFVTTFPSHPQHSEAAVRLGMARLWQDTSKAGDPVKALATAQAVLEDIEDEPEFRSSQRDLASLLPKIAQGLATQAEESTDSAVVADRVTQTREALALCMNTKYIPKEFRDDVLLGEVEDSLLRVERHQVQSASLAKALEEMSAALQARDIAKAYEIRDRLLDEHPALINDKSLAAKVAEVSTVEGEVIRFVAESREAQQGDRPTPVVAALTLADRKATGAVNAPGGIAVRVGGAIYGLKASDGSLLWRQYVGADSKSNPLPLGNGDFLVVDSAHHELVRLEGATGKAVWRQSFEGEALRPVIAGDVAYVAKPEGAMLLIDLASGKVAGEIKFGQGLAVPPAVDQSTRRLYLLGEHSSLYTLSIDDHKCLGVYYLGQAAGSVVVPPVKILNKLIVVANSGAQSSRLTVLSLDEQALPTAMDAEKRLQGTVDTPLLAEGRRLVAITSLGEISVFDIANATGKAALNIIAKRDADKNASLARFSLLKDGIIWLADNQLSKLAVQATSKSIRLGNLDDDFAGDTFNDPLQVVGDAVIHLRRPSRGSGSIVAATDAVSGKTAWQTEIAAPLAGAPSVDTARAQIAAITSTGAAYFLDREAMTQRIQDRPTRPPGSSRNLPDFSTSVALGQEVMAAGVPGADTILLFHPSGPSPLSPVKLPSELATDLVGWRDGFIAATKVGQVFLLSSADGKPIATPFQPPLEAGQEYEWLSPATYRAGDDARFVISDGKHAIYLVGYVAEPQPHLEAVSEGELPGTVLNTRLAVADDLAAAGAEGGSLCLFKLPALEAQPAIELGGQVTWGPFAAGSGLLFATDQGDLLMVTKGGEIAWRVPLEGKEPTGVPLVDGENAFIAWQLSGVSRLNLRDGSLPATTPLEQAILAGPVAFATRLVVAASDGTLLVINRP
jgi:tetratricopeptide (TPR) repeat protein